MSSTTFSTSGAIVGMCSCSAPSPLIFMTAMVADNFWTAGVSWSVYSSTPAFWSTRWPACSRRQLIANTMNMAMVTSAWITRVPALVAGWQSARLRVPTPPYDPIPPQRLLGLFLQFDLLMCLGTGSLCSEFRLEHRNRGLHCFDEAVRWVPAHYI